MTETITNSAASHNKNSPELVDGLLRFRIRDLQSGESVPHEVDVLVLKLACEECERKHNLEVIDGAFRPTPAFLVDLAQHIRDVGVPSCTPTVAHQLWCAAGGYIEQLKKNTNEQQSLPFGTEEPDCPGCP